jgi:hypothetical protein
MLVTGAGTQGRPELSSSTWTLLLRVAAAAIDSSPVNVDGISSDEIGWAVLAGAAEAHGLAPLAHVCLQPQRPAVPGSTLQQLEALVLRHRTWHRERTVALEEILQAFEATSIDAIVLKGAALAWTIYPTPALRPMGDADLLVPSAQIQPALLLLRRLGFDATETGRRFGKNAHHLPVASRVQNGLTISVEIHRDALSRDTLSSISMSNLTEPARRFDLNSTRAHALGHVDALRHLTHHLLEPSWDGWLRLVGLVDLVRYALTFHDRIDWRRLETSYPFVLNALRCVHYVTPLPAGLARFCPPRGSRPPARAGETPRPLRAILADGSPTAALGQLFNPPDWWLHAYYGVPADGSLTGVRLGRHPWRVARWVGLRASGL